MDIDMDPDRKHGHGRGIGHGNGHQAWTWISTFLSWLRQLFQNSDVGYRKKVYSDIRHNVRINPLHSITEVPIS